MMSGHGGGAPGQNKAHTPPHTTSSTPFRDMYGCGHVVARISRAISRSIIRTRLHCSHRQQLNGRTLTLKRRPSRNLCYYHPQILSGGFLKPSSNPCRPPFISNLNCKCCHGNLSHGELSTDSDYPSSDSVLSNHNSAGPRDGEGNTRTIK